MTDEFFPAKTAARPMIYAYEEDNPKYAGMLKIGFASAGVEKRVAEQFPILKPGDKKPYKIVFAESAMYCDGGSFTDKRIHDKLAKMGYEQLRHGNKTTEWFRCNVNALRAAWIAVKNRVENSEERNLDFAMRPEQSEAVEKTLKYYARAEKETRVKRTPKFLWNAKMRFGKTFATYQLAKRLGAKRPSNRRCSPLGAKTLSATSTSRDGSLSRGRKDRLNRRRTSSTARRTRRGR